MRLVLLLALAVLSAGTITVALRDDDVPKRQYAAEHPIEPPAISRSVFVSSTMPTPSRSPRRLSAKLESGSMPATRTTVEVLSDTDCAPDRKLISHCRNEVRLPDGSLLVLRHPHNMSRVPCLAPGEHVELIPRPA